MNSSMLEYCKIILEKMSFDPHLFKKEYRKSLRYLAKHECKELKKWIRENITPKSLVFKESKN
ncbi:MAG: hypothetical protein NW226_11125 [Microscillaceae bacterium]|nr:hypothetical protein [Microscillaceae bacterium]